ncbi:e608cfdb-bec7-48ee-95ed-f1b412b2a679 [Sclerotinia trifoliorum]|uniref:E608cfdb-bec7-48ee-95ed-f1b412b2a679 n=1 Tax=Sclerotinia trifoliorum TaxID=28548 RepID=A0A8H2ZW05_9HELO|nr:e608cfdb-bec7-48ee-95ed-f1b412b2a679 [Sclerotinia trifoliorum]
MGRGETNAKKRKRQAEATAIANGQTSNGKVTAPAAVDTSKPTALFQPTKGRDWTVSVALPGSIISNAQSHDLKTSMAGHIARAVAVFCVDEVIVFNDGNARSPKKPRQSPSQPSTIQPKAPSEDKYTGTLDPDHFLTHLLSYLETPPNLRKYLFPMHENLRTAGTLPSIDLPHHLRADEWCMYREGTTLPGADEHGTFVEAGLRIPVTVPEQIPENNRVTLKFDLEAEKAAKDKSYDVIKAEVVRPEEPREERGYYWGYNVRRAGCLSDVFTECGYDGGYDMTIGTSERGVDVQGLYDDEEQKVGKFKHLLVVFGGVAGLEVAVKNDEELQKLGVTEAKDVFDRWVNVCPGQGSRTIRTEEAAWIGLMGLRKLVVNNE